MSGGMHPDKRRALMVGKDMCRAGLAATGDRRCSGVKRLYWELCSLPAELPEQAPPLRLTLKESHRPEPGFLRDIQPVGDGRFLGVLVADKRLVYISSATGVDRESATPFEGIASLIRLEQGVALLSEKEQAIIEVDFGLNRLSMIPLENHGIPVNFSIRLSRNEDGYVLTDPGRKRLHFLHLGGSECRTVDLGAMDRMFKGEGFGQGVFLFEYPLQDFYIDQLMWVSPTGNPLSVLGGLMRPSQVRPCNGGLLVCDRRALHVLTLDGLSVTSRRRVLWKPLLEELGFDYGYGHEAFLSDGELVVKFDTGVQGVSNSQSICLATYALDWPRPF